MLATILDDTWNVLNMQHIIPNSKRWDYSDTPGGGHKKSKGPAHMVEGGHHLRKAHTHTFSWLLYISGQTAHRIDPVFALRFQNLSARNSSLKIFKHEKEGKLAGPAQFLMAEVLGPALNAKTVDLKLCRYIYRLD